MTETNDSPTKPNEPDCPACSRLARRVEELEKELAAHKDLFWPPATEEEEHIYEIRNGKTADYVRVHVEALAGAHAEEKPDV